MTPGIIAEDEVSLRAIGWETERQRDDASAAEAEDDAEVDAAAEGQRDK